MKAMKYLIRAAKYFLSLCVLSVVLVTVLYALGMAAGTPQEMLRMLAYTPKGWVFLAAIVFFSALWPRIGYTTVRLEGDLQTDRPRIDEAFRTEGYEAAGVRDSRLIYRATRLWRRIGLRFDDAVSLQQQGSWIEMEGARKAVVRIGTRLESTLKQDHE